MPIYMITLKDNAPKEAFEKAKQDAKDKGGEITYESPLTSSFHVKLPKDHVSVLESNEHVDVEEDQEVKI